MDDENKKDEPKVQADNNSIAVGGIHVGGSVGGDIRIGHTIGYTAEQVSVLLTQITTTLQPKKFDGRCPYKGLEVFEEEDAELFFGRERLVNELVGRVKESRTVFITGPSGSGKSSLVRAGLIYSLKQGAIKNSEGWLYETLKPGREPIKDLALAFSRLKSPELEDYFLTHSTETNILNKCAESVLSGRKDQRFVLFIDQFEEVFTQISGEEERIAFINMLAHAGTIENGRVMVIFAMRSDFVSNCATYPALNELLSQEFRQIGAMQPEELVSAIALPARHVGLPIEDELIARIINDMRGEPDALPLMQFALKDLFDAKQAEGGVIALTLKDYLKHGGIHKSLERHADATFAKLSEREQELTRSIFSGLIEIGRGTQDTKRTALFDELIPANTTAEDIGAIVQKLADARLVITDEQAGKDTVTISHEKLIEAWPWLKKLVNENRDVIALQNEITSDAKEWDEHDRDASYLYIGARLAGAREQLDAKKLVLSGLAQDFIKEGIALREAERKAKESLRRRIITGLTAGIAIALVLAGLAVYQMFQAQEQSKIALARQLASQAQSIYATYNSDQMIAALVAIQSMKVFPNWDAAIFLMNNNDSAPLTSRMTHEGRVLSVAFSPDGKYVVSAGCDELDANGSCVEGTARVWEAATGQELAHMTHDESVLSVAFSPDGKYVVSGSFDNTVRVWEAATGQELARMTHDGWVSSLAFSPDGKYVVSAGCDERDNANGSCVEGTARVWEAATGQELARMTYDEYVSSVAFSPDGKYVVSGSEDFTARVWEAVSGQELARMTLDGPVYSVTFSPDGKYVVSAGCGELDANGSCVEGTAR
ncbi:MAG: AAA family ATPase, partial [Anaerolineales bacterium]